MNDLIQIEVLKGGFVLQYPLTPGGAIQREVLATQRKLVQRVKEVIELLSFVPATSDE